MLTRRKFLTVGAAGALLLATARLGRGQTEPGNGYGARRNLALDRTARDVLAAIVPVLLAGAVPGERSARTMRIAATIDGVERAIGELPSHAQADFRALLTLLGFAPARWLQIGRAHV